MLALLAQPAFAQGGLGSVDLAPVVDHRTAEAGGKAVFRIQAVNRHILDQDVAFVAYPPEGWTYVFSPANLTLAPGASGNVTLEVAVPAGAKAEQKYAVPVEARAHSTDLLLGRSSVNVTVVPPPPGRTVEAPAAPPLELSVSPSAGQPGQTVEGLVTLRNGGGTRLDVTLTGTGPAGWNPRFLPGDDFHVLYPGDAARTVRVYASIPSGAAPNTTWTLTVTAAANGFQYPATWSVAARAPAAASTGDAGDAQPASTGAGSASSVPPAGGETQTPETGPAPAAALDARLVEPLLQVAPGGSARGALRLENTGNTPLKLRLVGGAPSGWAAPALDRATLDLAPGAVEEVGFTLAAPADVIPSTTGRGAGSIMATAEGGLVRTARYEVMVVPAAPKDASDPTTETNAAALDTGGEGWNVPTATIGLAAAFGALGAGAVAIANRPLREKLLWGAVGLYTRLARPDVLGHEDREKLYQLVEKTPGIHFHALQRDLAWNTGTLTYHLRVLEKHGFVVSRRDGLYRRFYLQGSAPRKEVFENQGPSGLRADVLEAIRNRHGMSQSDLALALGANKQTVNYHVKALERQGVIRLEKRGRETFLYPSEAPAAAGPGEADA